MRWILAPLLFVACTTDSPEIKKVSFAMKETCINDVIVWKPKVMPDWWEAYRVTKSGKQPLPVTYSSAEGFVFECTVTSPDTIEVYYQYSA